jgi:mannose-6-phosphate isomerase-like protein (cupin superfamily)
VKYVIIGNGPAAVTAAETIRRADDAGEITLLSKEDEFTYSRPLISYLLCGKTDETRMRYKPADFYARNRVDFRSGVAAVSIDKDEKTVFTPQDMFVKEDEQLCGSITWLVPDAQKNTMEPILVDLGEDGRTYELLPHQGEEFGYVLSGSIFLVDGETKTRIRAGSSFCLHPHETHYLMNAGKSHAKVLWISTPPSF